MHLRERERLDLQIHVSECAHYPEDRGKLWSNQATGANCPGFPRTIPVLTLKVLYFRKPLSPRQARVADHLKCATTKFGFRNIIIATRWRLDQREHVRKGIRLLKCFQALNPRQMCCIWGHSSSVVMTGLQNAGSPECRLAYPAWESHVFPWSLTPMVNT